MTGWKQYRERVQKYNEGRFKYYMDMNQHDIKDAMNFLWDGNGKNPNAALTIFRHYDSASVDFGLVGSHPDTAWVMDYPLFERIHYLLVAGYNVYGNMKHQLNTRLYMDFLRMEGEDMFLSFLPSTDRKTIRDSWYEGMRQGYEMELGDIDQWMILKDVYRLQDQLIRKTSYTRTLSANLHPYWNVTTSLTAAASHPVKPVDQMP